MDKDRLALVFGNSDYENMTPLENATKDAVAVCAKLEKLGFTVTSALNSGRVEMLKLFGLVKKEWERHGKEIVIYYSGHGSCVDEMVYITPIDADPQETFIFKETLIPIGTIIGLFSSHRIDPSSPIILILDCCRSNIGKKGSNMKKINHNSGIGSNANNIAILYSTGSDQEALDAYEDGGEISTHSPYTKHLLHFLDEDLNIHQLDTAIRKALTESTYFPLGQTTWMTSSLLYEYKFNRSFNSEEIQISNTAKGKRRAVFIHVAAAQGNVDIVKQLLTDTPTLVNSKDISQDTPLHLAAAYGHAEVVKLLHEYRADLNAKDEEGRAPLHRAVNNWAKYPNKMIKVIELLRDFGAELEAKDNNGNLPLDLIDRMKFRDFIRSQGNNSD